MSGIVNLTKKGHRVFSGAEDISMPIGSRLFLEVLARTGPMDEQEVDELCDELEDFFGSADKAIAALKSGETKIKSGSTS